MFVAKLMITRYANLLELEMQQRRRRNSKEDIELRSLDNCPHVISNPMSGYGAASYPSSQSLPRNPTLVANPLDAYYVDSEIQRSRQHRRTGQPRRPRRTSFSGLEDADVSRHRRRRRRSRAGSEERTAIGKCLTLCALNLCSSFLLFVEDTVHYT